MYFKNIKHILNAAKKHCARDEGFVPKKKKNVTIYITHGQKV